MCVYPVSIFFAIFNKVAITENIILLYQIHCLKTKYDFQAKLSSSKHKLPFQFCVNGLPGGKPTDKHPDKNGSEGRENNNVSSIRYTFEVFKY